jgi:Methyladenine glycosylase
MLFELLVLSGAQVGSDWTTILKRRNEFRLELETNIQSQRTSPNNICMLHVSLNDLV